MSAPLLPANLLPRLERLSLGSARRVRGTAQGKRRSANFGASLEFADYREYTPGDDIRRFDWSVYRRTGRPFVRQYWDEQEMYVSLYLDVSASMDFGGEALEGPPAGPGQAPKAGDQKLEFAKKLAAAVGYMALSAEDRVQAALFSEKMVSKLPFVRGKASAARLFSFLQEARATGAGNLAGALRHPTALPVRPGMVWIFSDFWLEGGAGALGEALSYLLAAGQEIVIVQVVSRDELEPRLSGDLRLVDSELGTGKELAVTANALDAYRRELNGYTAEISAFCSERGIRYIQVPTDRPLEKAVFEMLRGAGTLAF